RTQNRVESKRPGEVRRPVDCEQDASGQGGSEQETNEEQVSGFEASPGMIHASTGGNSMAKGQMRSSKEKKKPKSDKPKTKVSAYKASQGDRTPSPIA